MTRTYPPKWCEKSDCRSCDFLSCDEKIINLFEHHKNSGLNEVRKNKNIDTTVVGIYLSYCERLAKYFSLFPVISPNPVVFDNFLFSETGEPAEVNIQRILLDLLTHGIPDAPTDDVHKIRLILFESAIGAKKGKLMAGDKEIHLDRSKKENDEIREKAKVFANEFITGQLTEFKKTDNIEFCKYCFINDCEEI